MIRVLLRKLDVAAEAYLDRQQMINLLAVPGTVLFLLLFWAFSGAGGLMLLLGLFLTALEIGIAVGLFLLKDKYADQLQEWVCAADAIEAHLTGGDVFDEWNEFLQNPAGDPELEQIRATCQVLPDQYPPKDVGEYCGPEGIALMHDCIERLRVGIVSKGYEDFRIWWATRQEAKHFPGDAGPRKKGKKRKKKTAPEGVRQFGRATAAEADAMMRVAKMSGGILDPSEQARIEGEADKESARAAKEARREERRASRTARKATKQALKQEKKLRRRAAMMESVEDEMVLYQDSDEDESERRPRPAAVAPMQAPPQRSVAEEHEEEEEAYDDQPQERAHHVPLPRAAPPPPAPARRRQRGLTEAAAIEQVMQGGLTAHHYDDAQHRLAERLGRDPRPSEVVKALKAQFSKKSRKRAEKKEKQEKKRSRGKRVHQPLAAFRIDAGHQDLRHHRPIRPAGPVRTFARVVFVLGLIASLPFAAWRIPQPEAKPITLEGEVRHELLDHAPDIQHQLRTPFEELLGYKPVTLLDGERLYVNEEDYGLCWPESWDEIYENRYTVRVTAEVTKLLFGGYSIASITSAERVDLPVATGTDYSFETPAPPEQWRPTRRIHRPGLGR